MARAQETVTSVQGVTRRMRKEFAMVSSWRAYESSDQLRVLLFCLQTWMSAVGTSLCVVMGPTASTLQGATGVTVSALSVISAL